MNGGELKSSIAKICRLCATKQDNGQVLFAVGSEEMDKLVKSICCLLDIEFRNDGELPNWLCSRCQTEAARMEEFIQLVKNGQVKLIELVTHWNVDIKIEEEFIETDSFITQAPSIEYAEKLHDIEIKAETICTKYRETDNKEHKTDCIEQQTEELVSHSKRLCHRPLRLLDEIQMKTFSKPLCNAQPDKLENARQAIQDLGENIEVESNKESENVCSPKKYFICEYCKDVFPQQQALLQHIKTHNNYIYECHECLQTFSNKNCFSQHQTLTGHLGVGINDEIGDQTEEIQSEKERSRLGDEVATTAFSYVGGANGQITSIDQVGSSAEDKNHVTQQSQWSPESDVKISYNDGIKKQSEKQFTCNVYPKSSHTTDQRKVHNRVHTEEKPFKCLICLRTFGNRSNLFTHNRVHTGVYKCSKCESTFKYASHLKKHKEKHMRDAQSILTVEQEVHTYNSEVQSTHQTFTGHYYVGIIEDVGAQKEEHVNFDKDLSRLGAVEATAATNIVVDSNDQIASIDQLANSVEEKVDVSQARAGETQDSLWPPASNVTTSYKDYCFKKLSNSDEYACVACLKTYNNHYAVRRHYKKKHLLKKFRCSLCLSTFKVKYHYELHLRTHSE